MNSMICPYCGKLITYNSFFDVFYCSKCGGFFKQATVMECNDLNDPLTLDELRQMDGEPVYCVEITGREEWLFRRDGGFADMYGQFTSDDFMVWDNYGKLWWCYRQKPEEDDHA